MSYVITGAGPAGTSFSETIPVEGAGTVNVPALLAGNWQVTVDGFNGANGEGARVATGVATTSVGAGSVSQLTVNVGPTTGEGTFDVTIDWSDAVSEFVTKDSNISATGTLSQGRGGDRTEVTLIQTTADDVWSVNQTLDAGWYVFEWALKDGDVNIYTIREAVRIMGDGLVTSASPEITADDVTSRGQIGITIELDMQDPLNLGFGETAPDVVRPGESFSVTINGLPVNPDVEWTLNNELIYEDVPGISLSYSELKPGFNSVSAVVYHDDGRVSSIGFRVEAQVPDATVFDGGSIQAAINLVSDGAVIEVRAGTYSGFTVPAGKSLTIYGPNAGVAGVNHNAPAAIINGLVRFNEASTIDGFTIRGEGSSTQRLVIPTNTNGSVIRNNIIENAFRGIQGDVFGRPKNLTITGNLITTDYGVAGTEDSTGLVISGNTFDNEDEAVGLGVGFALEGFNVNSLGMMAKVIADNNFVEGSASVVDYRPPVKIVDDGEVSQRFNTIQAAINAADDGDVIVLSSGDFDNGGSPIALNKAVTLQGANAGLSGDDPARAAESRIVNTRINVSAAATVDGIEVYQTNNTAEAVYVSANATVKNSVIRREGLEKNKIVRGVLTASGTNGYTISNNLFTGSDIGGFFSNHVTWNSGVWLNGGSGTVAGNTFENVRTGINADDFNSGITIANNTFRTSGTYIAFGGTSRTDGQYTISDNEFYFDFEDPVTNWLPSAFFNLSNVEDSFRIDATDNTFGGIDTSDLTFEQKLGIEARMFHRGRAGRRGVVDFVEGEQIVVPGTTIQSAIDAASAGDTILVGPGDFSEVVNITKAVTLEGANAGIAAGNNPGDRGGESVITGGFEIGSTGVLLDGFSVVSGFGPANNFNGIYVNANGATVLNTIVENVTASNGRGILTASGVNSFTLRNSTIRENTHGIYFNPGSGHRLSDNLIDSNNGVGIGSSGLSDFEMTNTTISNNPLEGWGADTIGADVRASNMTFIANGNHDVGHYGGQAITVNGVQVTSSTYILN